MRLEVGGWDSTSCFCGVKVSDNRNGDCSALCFSGRTAIAYTFRLRGCPLLPLGFATNGPSFNAFKRIRFVQLGVGGVVVMDTKCNGRALRLAIKSGGLLPATNVNSVLRVDSLELSALRVKEANVSGGRVVGSQGRDASLFSFFCACLMLREGRATRVFFLRRVRNVQFSTMNNARDVPSFSLFLCSRFCTFIRAEMFS